MLIEFCSFPIKLIQTEHLMINKLKACVLLAFYFTSLGILSQRPNIAERLGYPADSKLLILHADDLAVAHSENAASLRALEVGPVNSASIMVPCPWFLEIATYARENSHQDFGLHLTLTSEWKNYKWGPVTSKDSVSSLVGSDGYFYPGLSELITSAKKEEVKVELRNQVKKAYRSGIDVTHLDAHMGAAVSTPQYARAYMEVGKEFNLPVLLDKRIYALNDPDINALLDDHTVVLDRIYMEEPADFKSGTAQFYANVIKNLEPGLNLLLVHLAYDDQEMQAMTIDHPDYGAAWRQADFNFVTSAECQKLMNENNIVMVTWRELRDKIVRGE